MIEESNQGGGGKNVESKEEDNIADDMVKDLNIVEANNDCGAQVNHGNNVDTQVGNGSANVEVKDAAAANVQVKEANANVEVKEAGDSETLNDAVVRDVCMDEVEPKQDDIDEEKANL